MKRPAPPQTHPPAHGYSARASRFRALGPDTVTLRERQLLTTIRNAGEISRSDLIKQTGLSGVAVFRGTEDLAAHGLLDIGATVVKGRGQPSATVRLRPRALATVGLSIMTDYAEAVLMDFTGAVLAKRDLTLPGMPREALLDGLMRFITDSTAEAGLGRDTVLGLGVAVAGFFTGDGDKLNPAQELDDWALVDLKPLIEAHTGVPTMIENTASAAAVGERLLGVGRWADSFGYLNFAGGLGAGLIVKGELVRGHHGNAGEVGGLAELAGLPHPQLDSLRVALTARGVVTTGITDLVRRYDDDWPGVADWVAAHVPSFNLYVSAFRYIADCEVIVIGGRVPPALARRIADTIIWVEATRPVRRDIPPPAPKIVIAEVSSESTAIGAAAMPLRAGYFL